MVVALLRKEIIFLLNYYRSGTSFLLELQTRVVSLSTLKIVIRKKKLSKLFMLRLALVAGGFIIILN